MEKEYLKVSRTESVGFPGLQRAISWQMAAKGAAEEGLNVLSCGRKAL
jgi:hypothetical protein